MDADRAVARGASAGSLPWRTRTARVELRQVATSELGLFLQQWREQTPMWRITRVVLAASKQRGTRPGRYDVTLELTARYVAIRMRSDQAWQAWAGRMVTTSYQINSVSIPSGQ